MIQLRAGDLVAIEKKDLFVFAAILTKQIMFGGSWTYVFHGASKSPSFPYELDVPRAGFHAIVDFIQPKRDKHLHRISRGNEFGAYSGAALLKQRWEPPMAPSGTVRIFEWVNKETDRAKLVLTTRSPSLEQQGLPNYSTIGAYFAWFLSMHSWTSDQPYLKVPDEP